MKQPILGLLASAFGVVIALGFIALFTLPMFMGWVSYVLTCMVPAELVVCVFWRSRGPEAVERLGQPIKGIILSLFILVVGGLVALICFFTVGGGYGPPTPMVTLYVISVVCLSFTELFVLNGWPFTKISNRLIGGLSLLASLYLVGYVVFRIFFNFSFMAGAPVYVASLDPHGLFNAWIAVTFLVATVAAIFIAVSFDLWPLSTSPKIMSLLPVIWSSAVILTALGLFGIFRGLLGLDVVRIMVNVLIAYVFGSIVVVNMLQGSLFAKVRQPIKGFLTVATSALVGLGLASAYSALEPHLSKTQLPAGPPQYGLEVWLASAMLAVTFPLLSGLSGLFEYWPFVSGSHKPTEVANAD